MSNPQGQSQGQERQPGESEQDYQDRLRRTAEQGTEAPDSGEATGTQDR